MDLAPFTRRRVVFRHPDTGRRRSITALRDVRETTLLGRAMLSFEDERNGDLHLLEASLVVEVIAERQDRHTGKWVRVGPAALEEA